MRPSSLAEKGQTAASVERDLAWRPSSSLYPDDEVEPGDAHDRSHGPDSALDKTRPQPRGYVPASRHRVPSAKMNARPALEQISPPSSPEVGYGQDG